MDFFNKAKESLSAAGKGFTQKANDVSGIARVTMFPELTERIRLLYAELEKDRVELAFLKGKKICPNCGTELEAELQCCTVCGINVENVERPAAAPVQKFCSNCGNPIPEGSKFCMNCGTKVE